MSFAHERNWNNQCEQAVGAPHRNGLGLNMNIVRLSVVPGGFAVFSLAVTITEQGNNGFLSYNLL